MRFDNKSIVSNAAYDFGLYVNNVCSKAAGGDANRGQIYNYYFHLVPHSKSKCISKL